MIRIIKLEFKPLKDIVDIYTNSLSLSYEENRRKEEREREKDSSPIFCGPYYLFFKIIILIR